MAEQTNERVEVRKKTEKRTNTSNGTTDASVERREEYERIDEEGPIREERLVRDKGAERAGLAHKAAQFIWLLGGLLEAFLGLRFLLKLIAANPNSPFTQFVYQFTNLFLWPFQALTATPSTSGGAVLEIPTLFAMLVYGIAIWAAVKLVKLALMPSTSEKVTVYRREEG
ncbi:MAG: YggT family protein [Candidatus Promineifilaceae bacterium]|nr:YggT family protein [Candidatus Promineifilaceae bacterium]